MIRRLLDELRRRHTTAEVEDALASVAVCFEDDVAVISREEGAPLFGPPAGHVTVARLSPGVYARTPTRGARVRLLDRAASLANEVEVHVPIVSDGTHRGRLAIDVPRRVARAIGLASAEPGDRFDRAFVHAFFDDEPIIEEASRAGLRFIRRRGPWVHLERASAMDLPSAPPPRSVTSQATPRARFPDTGRRRGREPDAFVLEVVRTLGLVRYVERLRVTSAPEQAVRAMRERGQNAGRRGPVARARLRRAIGWVDAAYVRPGPNCFRRVLLEIGLDAGAAGETLVFGLDVGRTGHVAFKDAEDRAFDVAFEVPP